MKTLIVAAGVMIEQGRILVTQRKKDSPHGLLWEFPGGKVEEGEEPRQTLRRELMEELGVEVEVGMVFDVVYHFYPDDPVLLLVYHCRISKGILKPVGCHALRWVDLEGLKELAMPAADEPIRSHLVVHHRKNPIFKEH